MPFHAHSMKASGDTVTERIASDQLKKVPQHLKTTMETLNQCSLEYKQPADTKFLVRISLVIAYRQLLCTRRNDNVEPLESLKSKKKKQELSDVP